MKTEINEAESATLDSFVSKMLLIDPEWLDASSGQIIYHYSRLTQEISIAEVSPNEFSVRCRIPVVLDVQDLNLALQLCEKLNADSPAGVLWVNVETQSIELLVGLTIASDRSTWWYFLASSMQIGGWFANSIADEFAEQVKGKVASRVHPKQGMVRENHDQTSEILTARRNRPEWAFDPTEYLYPEEEDCLQHFAVLMSGPGSLGVHEVLAVGDGRLVVGLLDDADELKYMLRPGFEDSEILGVGYRADLVFFNLGVIEGTGPSVTNDLNKLTFEAEVVCSLGAWVSGNNSLSYRLRVPTSNLLGLQANPSNQGLYRSTLGLWEHIATMPKPHFITEVSWSDEQISTELRDDLEDVANGILAGIFSRGESGIDKALSLGENEVANRDLLWLRNMYPLFNYGYFNPIGPTVGTVGIVSLPHEKGYAVIYLRRHPFVPLFDVLSTTQEITDLYTDLPSLLQGLEIGAPSFIQPLGDGSVDFSEALKNALRPIVMSQAERSDIDLMQEANELAQFGQNPWDYASQKFDESIRPFSVGADPFDSYYQAATDYERVMNFWMQLSSAWDGALNFQSSHGNLGRFDVGPMPLVYSAMGLDFGGETED